MKCVCFSADDGLQKGLIMLLWTRSARVQDVEVYCTVAELHMSRAWKTIGSFAKTVLTCMVYRRTTSVIFVAKISYCLQSQPGVYILHKGVHSSRGYNYSWIKIDRGGQISYDTVYT